ncbi:MAG TPA: TolC family protein, partial [Cytophagales bacterium]
TRSAAILDQNLRLLDEKEREVKNLEKEGIVTANDVLRVQLQKNNLQLSKLDLETARETSLYNFALMLGLPDNQPLAVDTTLAAAGPASVSAAEDLQTQALQNRQELQAGALREKAARSGLRAARSAYFPHLGLSAGYNYVNPNANVIPEPGTFLNAWNAGVTLSYNLSSLYGWRGRMAEARVTADQARLQTAQQTDAVKNEVFGTYKGYQVAGQKIAVNETALAQAGENYRLIDSKFRNGLVLSSDLLEAQTLMLQAQLNLLNAQVDARVAYYRLQKATGNLDKK